jgi:hypothetical protein
VNWRFTTMTVRALARLCLDELGWTNLNGVDYFFFELFAFEEIELWDIYIC